MEESIVAKEQLLPPDYDKVCESCRKIVDQIRSIIHPKIKTPEKWFTTTQLKSMTNLSYDQAEQMINTLIRYGFAVEQVVNDKYCFKVVDNYDQRLHNLHELMAYHKKMVATHYHQIRIITEMAKVIDPEFKYCKVHNLKFE